MFLNGFIFSRIVAFLSTPGAPQERFLSLMFTNTYFWIFTLFIVPIITMRLFAEERKAGHARGAADLAGLGGDGRRSASSSARSASSSTLWVAEPRSSSSILRSQTAVDLGPVASGYLGIALFGRLLPRDRRRSRRR